MKKFTWYEAKSIEDALEQINATVSDALYNGRDGAAVVKSGGVDVLDLMKEGLLQPGKLVNIRNIKGLDSIFTDRGGGLVIGCNTTLGAMEEHADIRTNYPALFQAVAHAATPQLRNMSTIAGNIAQRNRCWYFRSADHKCFRKGGDRCFARHDETGENENHAILMNGSCVSVHASSVATALLAYGAKVEITNADGKVREVEMDDFFVGPGDDISRENILQANELITAVRLPAVAENVKSAYIKQVARESYDWSLGDVAVVVELKGQTVTSARIALGAAAPIPMRAIGAEDALKGKKLNAQSAAEAAEAAMARARPLSKNGYKVPLFKSIIQKAILELA